MSTTQGMHSREAVGVVIEHGKFYLTADGTRVWCRGRSPKYPKNWVMAIREYPNTRTFSEYLVFDSGMDCWRVEGLRIVAEDPSMGGRVDAR